jgi:hypothetical protein
MKIYAVLLPLLAAVFLAAAPLLSEDQKIAMLIEYVRTLNGSVFIRNGSEYAPDKAAEHLAMKRKNAGTRVKSAEDFIEVIASKSYLSGKPYLVRLKDGTVVTAKDLLSGKLKEIEAGKFINRTPH